MSGNSTHVVRLEGVDVVQEEQIILTNISFTIQKGEFVYLIGKTGSGKSSLLKMLYGDLSVEGGQAEVVDFSLIKIKQKDIPFLRRSIGIIFQDFELFYDRSIAENLEFVMKATGWKIKYKIKSRLAEVLMRVGLGAVSSKMPHQLSGGEQQRVAVARALINEPKILFADEPTGNLDPHVADGILKLFQEINRSGTAVLMATHNHSFLKKYPQRVLKCERGVIKDSKYDKFQYAGYLDDY